MVPASASAQMSRRSSTEATRRKPPNFIRIETPDARCAIEWMIVVLLSDRALGSQ